VKIDTINICPCCQKTMKTLRDLPKFPLTKFYEEYADNFDNKSQNILLASVTTKSAARAILNKLVNLNTKNILCPVMYL